MRSFAVLVIQLALAAVVGYWAGHAGRDEPATAVPPVSPPVTSQAPPPASAPSSAATPSTATVENVSLGFRTAVQRAAPSVLTVYSARTASRGILGMGGRAILSQGLGSGVVLDAAGHVVTNNHVVEGANELAVALPDGSLRGAKVLGVDPDSDLALLEVDPTGLEPITMGDTRNLAVGDIVLAVGNPLGVGQTVTQGIVSALGRKGIGINPIENFIQTDAAINPGNSGGALIDTQGRLVGINSAILSRGGGSEGIGFAIPVDIEQRVVASLLKTGRVARGGGGGAAAPAGGGGGGGGGGGPGPPPPRREGRLHRRGPVARPGRPRRHGGGRHRGAAGRSHDRRAGRPRVGDPRARAGHAGGRGRAAQRPEEDPGGGAGAASAAAAAPGLTASPRPTARKLTARRWPARGLAAAAAAGAR